MRIWRNGGRDGGSVHCLGNGMLCAYEQGPDIVQLFGPPYSAPSFLKLLVQAPEAAEAECEREPGTAVWRHAISVEGEPACEFTDFIVPGTPCMVRLADCRRPLALRLRYEPGVGVAENAARFAPGCGAAVLARLEAGAPFYGHYPMPLRQYQQAVFSPGVRCERTGPGEYALTLPVGPSLLVFCGGPGYPEAVAAAERALGADAGALLGETRSWWRGFSAGRKDFASLVPAGFPQRERFLELVDSVSVLIRAQQGAEGGVMAGHNYHLGYIRDQYGVSRCLLALGYPEEARAILSFYWDVWSRRGRLHNAQGIGVDAFHIHENDDVEITGYLIIQAFDYLRASLDEAFVRMIFPMLGWAFDAQKGRLHKHMLPFNGDETYIAGGLLPRDCINDGSAEATMLFIEAGRRLLPWAEANGLWKRDTVEENGRILDAAEAAFAGNFLPGGRLAANNPERTQGLALPRFRHGVCQVCGGFTDWTELGRDGLYACPGCLGGREAAPQRRGVHFLKSVSLMPAFVGSHVLADDAPASTADEIAREFLSTGRLPSRPDSDDTVGYDYGLLLYSLARMGHPAAGEVYAAMLAAADDTDAWVEYYKAGAPFGTRCRPWESGINLLAAIRFATGEG